MADIPAIGLSGAGSGTIVRADGLWALSPSSSAAVFVGGSLLPQLWPCSPLEQGLVFFGCAFSTQAVARRNAWVRRIEICRLHHPAFAEKGQKTQALTI